MWDEQPKQDEDEAGQPGSMHRRDLRASEVMAVTITTTNTDDEEVNINLCCMRVNARKCDREGSAASEQQRRQRDRMLARRTSSCLASRRPQP